MPLINYSTDLMVSPSRVSPGLVNFLVTGPEEQGEKLTALAKRRESVRMATCSHMCVSAFNPYICHLLLHV